MDAFSWEGGERLRSEWEYADRGVGGDRSSSNSPSASSPSSPCSSETIESSDLCLAWPLPTHSCLPFGISSSGGITYSGLPGKLTSVGLSIEKLRKRDFIGYSINELDDTREKITRPRHSKSSTDCTIDIRF